MANTAVATVGGTGVNQTVAVEELGRKAREAGVATEVRIAGVLARCR